MEVTSPVNTVIDATSVAIANNININYGGCRMSKTLDEIRMLDILPPNLLNDEKIVAATEALDSELKNSFHAKAVLHYR